MVALNHGNLESVSKTFPELVGKYRGFIDKALEAALKQGVSAAIGHGAPDPAAKRMMRDYVVTLIKLYFPIYMPRTNGAASGYLDAVAEKIFVSTGEAADFFAACVAYGLDPARTTARMVSKDVSFANANHHYTFKGTLVECYKGFTVTTAIGDRRHFVLYSPGQQELGRPTYNISAGFTERNRAFKK